MPHKLQSVNPANGSNIAEYSETTGPELQTALQQSVQTFNEWKRSSFEQRGDVLLSIAAALRANAEQLATLATLEMGKPIRQGREEVEKCAATLAYYAQHGANMLAAEQVATEATKSYVTYKPLGVVLAVMPWNFPYWQVFRAFAPIAMAGNVLVLKHASNVSGCALAIQDIVRAAAAPTGLLQTLLVPSAAVGDLIAHPSVAAVTLTGSTAAGRSVAEVAGRHLKKQVLELGGSDPYIILDDADINHAAEICVNGRLKNSGQSCVAAKRFIVSDGIAAGFELAMTRKMLEAKWGNPMDEANIVGPLARKDLRDQLHEQVTKSVALGARLLCGGYLPEGDGAYYPPTVLTDVVAGMPAYHEELFGPVAAIIKAENLQQAIDIANGSEFGLGAAVIGKDIDLAERIAADELEAGNCFVNDFVHSDARLPFGGVKNSGYGREIGSFGIKEFTNIKTVYVK
jgi:succinate-semialdehyde dehydrogenase / glutarate-semialdehyde dehydrogenase